MLIGERKSVSSADLDKLPAWGFRKALSLDHESLTKLRQTRSSHSAAVIRILLGLLFLSTGVMKFAIPDLRSAFSGQLAAAGIPFHSLNMWLVPAVEIGVGVLFILGFLSRLASLSAIVMMMVATYVHLVVDNPRLFPLQPEEPIIPIIAVALCLYLLWIGSGSWSLDLRGTPAGSELVELRY